MQNGHSHHPWMTEELSATREQARRFAEKEVAPRVESWREVGHSDPQVWKQLADLGLLLPELSEEYGGSGGSLAYQLVVQEELARVEAGLGIVTVHSIAAHYILNYGTDEQKQRWLPRLASGELLAAIAMSEPGAGSDLQGVRTRATREGEEYVINGSKIFISGGYNAGLIIVVCKTDLTQGAKGISLIVVETKALAGFKVGRLLNKIGLKASDTAELFFDEVRVPAGNLLGGVEGRGFYQLMQELPFERMQIAAGAVAVVERAVELTVQYTKERKAFGQSIFDFQNTRMKLAECKTLAQVMRSYMNDCTQQLVDGKLSVEAACMAKWWCTEQQCKVLDECLQFFGGYGFMHEQPIARFYADSRAQKIYGGANEVMKEVIAKSL
ncbi:acyl-CoA dehydrogenase family protein [Pseudomonas sp. GOM7]|uniref:acyl-CoA dehydrogenase family protein n=1 Tax=Pseudomonas sp. GOM7 TaxID=2998079 RepID=UPI00227C80A0|nr:acyl-CoA dehydrogenase family protein [Pseudomonas sp. GOM7]WAJ39140.1 acyl-CoA dehydrogenase family protein [Pseudomonas sp. GOM7]